MLFVWMKDDEEFLGPSPGLDETVVGAEPSWEDWAATRAERCDALACE